MEPEIEAKKQKLNISWKTVLAVVVFLGLAGGGGYFYWQYQHSQKLLSDPAAAALEELNKWVTRIGRHITLPTDETPQLATITAADQLSEVPFFADAKNGDIFLRYPQSGRAVLYRPSTDKVIEVTTLVSSAQPETAGESTASAQLVNASLTVYNGTNSKGLAGEAQQKVENQITELKPITKTNATGNYQQSLVVVLNPLAQDLGDKLGKLFGASITGDLPEGEVRPDTDLLLIVGEDFTP